MKLKMVKTQDKSEEKKEVLYTGRFGTDISALLTKASQIQSNCHDFNVSKISLDNMMYHDGELHFIPDGCAEADKERYPMSRYSLSQLGVKLGVPVSYLQKCLNSGRSELCADNINSWLSDYGKDLFIREYGGHIRGILTSRYSVCDTPDILSILKDTIDFNAYKVRGSFLNEERFHLRLISKELLPVEGEVLFSGLFIDSSDVGRSVLTVRFGIYKQVCANGLIISKGSGTLFRQKHISIDLDQFREGLITSLKNVDMLCEIVCQFVKDARNKSLGFIRYTQEDFDNFTAQIKGSTKLSNEGANKVIDLMKNKYGDSKWGYINSITEVAQEFSLERRLELENIAGKILMV